MVRIERYKPSCLDSGDKKLISRTYSKNTRFDSRWNKCACLYTWVKLVVYV